METKYVVVIVVLLTACSGTQGKSDVETACSEYRDALAKLILKFIDNLKSHMDVGIPSLGIPPLDPLQLKDDGFHVSKPYQYDVSGRMRDSKVEGLKEFNVTSLSTSLMHLQVNTSVLIPQLFVTGDYSLKGKVLSLIPISGHGPFILKPVNPTATVTSRMAIHSGYLSVKDMNFHIDMDSIFVNFEGLFGGGSLGSLANSMMNRFALSLFRRIEPKVHEKLRVALITVINDKLKDIPLSDLIGAMNPGCRDAAREHFNGIVESREFESPTMNLIY